MADEMPLWEQACSSDADLLSDDEIGDLLSQLAPSWRVEGPLLVSDYDLDDFHQIMAFANAVAWIAHQQDHHPDLQLGYNHCRIKLSSHEAGGLTRNDFICAARIDRLQR